MTTAVTRRRWLPRFSLQTLMLGALLAGCVALVVKNREPWQRLLELPYHQNEIKSAQLSPDGTRVMTLCEGSHRPREDQLNNLHSP